MFVCFCRQSEYLRMFCKYFYPGIMHPGRVWLVPGIARSDMIRHCSQPEDLNQAISQYLNCGAFVEVVIR